MLTVSSCLCVCFHCPSYAHLLLSVCLSWICLFRPMCFFSFLCVLVYWPCQIKRLIDIHHVLVVTVNEVHLSYRSWPYIICSQQRMLYMLCRWLQDRRELLWLPVALQSFPGQSLGHHQSPRVGNSCQSRRCPIIFQQWVRQRWPSSLYVTGITSSYTRNDVTALWSQRDLHFVGQHVVLCVVKWQQWWVWMWPAKRCFQALLEGMA